MFGLLSYCTHILCLREVLECISVCDINHSVLAHVCIYVRISTWICEEFKCPETHRMCLFALQSLRKKYIINALEIFLLWWPVHFDKHSYSDILQNSFNYTFQGMLTHQQTGGKLSASFVHQTDVIPLSFSRGKVFCLSLQMFEVFQGSFILNSTNFFCL